VADWKDEDPFAGSGSDDPFAGEAPSPVAPVVPPTKPSYWQGMKNVTGAYLRTGYQPLKMGAEAATGWVQGLGQGVGQAGAMLGQGAAALAGGGGAQGALQAASEAQHEQLQQSIVPEWVHKAIGEPSWMGQGIGAGVNELVKRGIISEDSARNVGNLLMLVGFGGVAPKFAKLTAPYKPSPVVNALKQVPGAVSTIPDRWQKVFPSAPVRAGSVLADAQTVIPHEVPARVAELAAIKARAMQQAEAQQVLGVGDFPKSAAPNSRMRNLASELGRASADVAQSEMLTADAVTGQARRAIGDIIPREKIDPAAHEFVVRALEAQDAKAQTAADAANTALAESTFNTRAEAAENVRAVAEARVKAAVAEVDPLVPGKSGEVMSRQTMGERILERIRGTKDKKAVDTGAAAVQKVFKEAYKPFDEEISATAPTESMEQALKDARDTSTETGRVLSNYLTAAEQAETRLRESVDIPEVVKGQETGDILTVKQFPETASLSWWRGLKGELRTAASLAARDGKRDAARRLGDLSRMAEQGENTAAKAVGNDFFTGYDKVRSAYGTVYIQGMREGYIGKTLLPGQAWHGGAIFPTEVLPAMTNIKYVSNVLHAFGSEAAAKAGTALTGLSEGQLKDLGRPVAQEIVRPYIEGTLRALYDSKGGGKKGAAEVTKYLSDPKNAEMLREYGMDFGKLREASTKVAEPTDRMTGARIDVAKKVVAEVLPTTDSELVGRKILDAPSPSSVYGNFLRVSPDPAWKATIDTLVINELQGRVESGKNVFSDPKSLGLMQKIFTPGQIKGLRVYYETLQGLAEKTPKSEAPNLPKHQLDVVAQLGQAFPVGMKMWYAGKYMAKALAKMRIIDDDAAAIRWLNDAMMNPEKEKLAMDAYHGHKAAGEKLKAVIEADRKALAGLKKAYGPTEMTIPRVIGGVVAGAVSNAGQKKLPNEETKE